MPRAGVLPGADDVLDAGVDAVRCVDVGAPAAPAPRRGGQVGDPEGVGDALAAGSAKAISPAFAPDACLGWRLRSTRRPVSGRWPGPASFRGIGYNVRWSRCVNLKLLAEKVIG